MGSAYRLLPCGDPPRWSAGADPNRLICNASRRRRDEACAVLPGVMATLGLSQLRTAAAGACAEPNAAKCHEAVAGLLRFVLARRGNRCSAALEVTFKGHFRRKAHPRPSAALKHGSEGALAFTLTSAMVVKKRRLTGRDGRLRRGVGDDAQGALQAVPPLRTLVAQRSPSPVCCF